MVDFLDALLQIQSHPEFENSDKKFRVRLFNEFIEEIKTAEKEQGRKLRKNQLKKFKDLLEEMEITPAMTWKQVQEIINPHIEVDDELKNIDKVSIIPMGLN